MEFEDIKSSTASKVTDEEIQTAAAVYGLNKHHVKAILSTESGGAGFYADGKPRILFEAQLFSHFTNHQYDESNPTISSKTWNRALYSKHSEDEYNRLKEAMDLDSDAALKSASFGLCQILGENFHESGCASVEDFVKENCKNEIDQVKLFLHFIHSKGLIEKLKNLDWAGVAKGYNGPGYEANHYDEKLKENYEKSLKD